jgi:nucleoid DNA-binding protein
MKTSIPFLRRGEEREALIRTVDQAAGAANITSERFFIALTYWLEKVADEVAVGNVVPIPGLGKLAPWLEERKGRIARYNHGRPYSVPVFEPSPAFRAQVKATAPFSRKGKRSIQDTRRNNSRHPDTHRRVHATTQFFRDSITRQLEGAS